MIASLVSFVSRLTKRGKAVFYGALIVASFLVLNHLMLRPVLTKMAEQDKEIAEAKVSIRRALGIVAREEELLERAGVYAPYLKKLGSDETEKLALMDHIQSLASKSFVVVEEIKAGLKLAAEEGENAAFKRYVVSLRCEGEMQELVSFFYDLEGSEGKLLRIESFSMVLKGKDSSAIICTMEIFRYIIL